MAAPAPTDKLARLEVYAAGLKQRLTGPVPTKHAKSEGSKAAFKQMVSIDLEKTEAQISRLKGV